MARLYTPAQAARAGLSTTDAAALAHSIRYCIDKLHVSASNRDVLRETRRRLRYAAKRKRKAVTTMWPRGARLFTYRVALAVHKANRDLYARVMRDHSDVEARREGSTFWLPRSALGSSFEKSSRPLPRFPARVSNGR